MPKFTVDIIEEAQYSMVVEAKDAEAAEEAAVLQLLNSDCRDEYFQCVRDRTATAWLMPKLIP